MIGTPATGSPPSRAEDLREGPAACRSPAGSQHNIDHREAAHGLPGTPLLHLGSILKSSALLLNSLFGWERSHLKGSNTWHREATRLLPWMLTRAPSPSPRAALAAPAGGCTITARVAASRKSGRSRIWGGPQGQISVVKETRVSRESRCCKTARGGRNTSNN